MVKIVEPSVKILYPNRPQALELMWLIELAGRTCYKSEDKITDKSYVKFIKQLIKKGHLSVIEHANVTVKFICDRGISHELVRHRIASYSQESTRYCRYEDEITVVYPPFENADVGGSWEYEVEHAEATHRWMLQKGMSPQLARSILPTCLKTEIVMTANLREWRYILPLRGSKEAHPQMRQLMVMLLPKMKELFPPVFEDIEI